MFEQKIPLKIAGHSSIRTCFGGTISILVYTLILAFAITRFNKMTKREEPFL
jgi:hypothetical protein